MVYRSYPCQLGNGSSHSSCSSLMFIHSRIDVQVHLSSLLSGYPYSFEWDAMQDVWVIRALVGNVLMDSVSFGYIFMSLGCFYSAIVCLLHITSFYSAIECSLPIASWFQIFLTSSAKLWFQILIITTIETNFNFPIIIGLYCCFSCVHRQPLDRKISQQIIRSLYCSKAQYLGVTSPLLFLVLSRHEDVSAMWMQLGMPNLGTATLEASFLVRLPSPYQTFASLAIMYHQHS